MARALNCKHCGSGNMEATNRKDIYLCKKCGQTTSDTIHPAAKIAIRAVVGSALTMLTFGFLPEEIQDAILDGAEDLM
ncbi:MAG: hypothetical protein IPN76_22300 [Saprospiraceae bacterium]|nr:hypothetical protein [Saprospiraceae bacterium]